jgi:hypothetical protein
MVGAPKTGAFDDIYERAILKGGKEMNLTKMMVISICSLSLATTAIAQDSTASRDLEPTSAENELINLG